MIAVLPRRPQTVIFDMDGLLIDSEALYRRSMMAAAAECGHNMQPDAYNNLCGCTWADITTLLVKNHGTDFPVEPFKGSWLKHHGLMSRDVVPLKNGVVECLDVLEASGVPCAVATSSGHETVKQRLGHFGLIERFNHIVARGDYDAPKPSPAPYLLAAEKLGVEPRFCLALEDSYTGVRSASAAGAMTVMIPDILHVTDEMQEKCVAICDSLFDVADFFRSG